ncbi:hypothetical protein BC940DRAFT_349527 [Gongronella butleri]|nr:hypothetical protein BC940DRAFT_349527 [Gongronella butleri]
MIVVAISAAMFVTAAVIRLVLVIYEDPAIAARWFPKLLQAAPAVTEPPVIILDEQVLLSVETPNLQDNGNVWSSCLLAWRVYVVLVVLFMARPTFEVAKWLMATTKRLIIAKHTRNISMEDLNRPAFIATTNMLDKNDIRVMETAATPVWTVPLTAKFMTKWAASKTKQWMASEVSHVWDDMKRMVDDAKGSSCQFGKLNTENESTSSTPSQTAADKDQNEAEYDKKHTSDKRSREPVLHSAVDQRELTTKLVAAMRETTPVREKTLPTSLTTDEPQQHAPPMAAANDKVGHVPPVGAPQQPQKTIVWPPFTSTTRQSPESSGFNCAGIINEDDVVPRYFNLPLDSPRIVLHRHRGRTCRPALMTFEELEHKRAVKAKRDAQKAREDTQKKVTQIEPIEPYMMTQVDNIAFDTTDDEDPGVESTSAPQQHAQLAMPSPHVAHSPKPSTNLLMIPAASLDPASSLFLLQPLQPPINTAGIVFPGKDKATPPRTQNIAHAQQQQHQQQQANAPQSDKARR